MLTHRYLAIILLAFVFTNTSEAKYNVLFILTEDQGAQMSLVGTPGLSTPNMGRIAKEGVCFNQAFVNYPVCSPPTRTPFCGS
jgi:arylsulfatase A-like enzyme